MNTDSILIFYNTKNKTFVYNSDMSVLAGRFDERPMWQVLAEDKFASEGSVNRFNSKLEEVSASSLPKAVYTELSLKSAQGLWHRWMAGFITDGKSDVVTITLTDTGNVVTARIDELTGLRTRKAFCKEIKSVLANNMEKAVRGEYIIIYFDIIKFKAVNEAFGMEKGDEFLTYIGKSLDGMIGENGISCRIEADRFAAFIDIAENTAETVINMLDEAITAYDIPIEIMFNAGVYVIGKEGISVDAMLDRAILAQSTIKGNYNDLFAYYSEELLSDMLGEQEIVGMMAAALSDKQFVVYYQPQYNHTTGMIIGAEALARWNNPEKGLISPGVFIPIFERNGFITNLDLYIFESVCKFIRKCIDNKYVLIPISTNFSRYDIFYPDFVEKLEEIRNRYDVPVKYLRVEITETSILGGSTRTNEVIAKLHERGYVVEMDDFGSGYSSLNVLKDIELDIIKLDMRFLSTGQDNNKGGTIISSVVRMAKWLSMPVIAEGVETVQQADFLRSIGCDYIQGFLYSKPLPEDKYVGLISSGFVGAAIPQMKLIENLDANNFWNPYSLETLIYSNYVGGAAIFDYHNGKIEILRVNTKYLSEICMNLTEKDLIESDPLEVFDEENKKIYLDMLEKAIETGEEQECETWRTLSSGCCGDEYVCIRSNVRMIGKSENSIMFYAMIRNITTEKHYYESILNSERIFKAASEQVGIYFWDFLFATRDMHPCFRCMRDLGLPPLVTNYPYPLIEQDIFPPEYADIFEGWCEQIRNGTKEVSGVVPLTSDRIPFLIRVTGEYDEVGNPVKAYCSATLAE